MRISATSNHPIVGNTIWPGYWNRLRNQNVNLLYFGSYSVSNILYPIVFPTKLPYPAIYNPEEIQNLLII